jgi:4-diphosphocytidyl-2-C-methyl-D-erythritol kinase
VGKRPDGYHLLETLFVPHPELFDDLTVSADVEDTQPVLLLSGRTLVGNAEDNLVVRAYRLVQADHPGLPNVRIRLHKRIPAGAGLGGGSSNAAQMLLALNELFELGLSPEQLHGYAIRLGADVPFFLTQGPQLATGIGDELHPWPHPLPYRIQVVAPGVHSDTALAYKHVNLATLPKRPPLANLLQQPIQTWQSLISNDLEANVFSRFPILPKLKAKLYADGALYASMTGSGSALFGLFPL